MTIGQCVRRGSRILATIAGIGGAVSVAGQQTPSAPVGPIRDAAAALAAAPQVTLTNRLIRATVLLPDAQRGFYRGSRFDWSGIISSLRYGDTEYYGLWFQGMNNSVRDYVFHDGAIVAGPNTAMVGPAEAFDPATPPGWAEAAAGGSFLKIGVGMLRKPADGANYSSFRPYEIVSPGTWAVARGRDRIAMTHTLNDAATGYGYVYRKQLRLVAGQPQLAIEHELTNTGKRPITTSMFNHNFLTLGGGAARARASLDLPFAIATTQMPAADAAEVAGGRIIYKRGLADRETVALPITGYGASATDSRFTVRTASGAGYTAEGTLPFSKLQLWSIRSTIAVEPYVTLTIAPGETRRWSYVYTYARPR